MTRHRVRYTQLATIQTSHANAAYTVETCLFRHAGCLINIMRPMLLCKSLRTNGPIHKNNNIYLRVPRKLDSPLLPVAYEEDWGLCLKEEWKPRWGSDMAEASVPVSSDMASEYHVLATEMAGIDFAPLDGQCAGTVKLRYCNSHVALESTEYPQIQSPVSATDSSLASLGLRPRIQRNRRSPHIGILTRRSALLLSRRHIPRTPLHLTVLRRRTWPFSSGWRLRSLLPHKLCSEYRPRRRAPVPGHAEIVGSGSVPGFLAAHVRHIGF